MIAKRLVPLICLAIALCFVGDPSAIRAKGGVLLDQSPPWREQRGWFAQRPYVSISVFSFLAFEKTPDTFLLKISLTK
jgi:hypothetical protein